MKPRLPPGAVDIANARAHGLKPAEPVIVSLVGWVKESRNPVVVADGPGYSWGFLTGLDVLVYFRGDAAVLRALLAKLAYVTECIGVWNVSTREGASVFPVFAARGGELHYLHLKLRRGKRLLRWNSSSWTKVENERFAA